MAYQDRAARQPHLALVKGRPSPDRETLVRVHEPFTVIDAIETERTTHSWSLAHALQIIAKKGEGVALLLNCAPAADVLFSKLSAAQSGQAHVSDTAPGGASAQLRHYGLGAAILRDLGVGKMLLLSQPVKMPSMTGFGLEVMGFWGEGGPHE